VPSLREQHDRTTQFILFAASINGYLTHLTQCSMHDNDHDKDKEIT